VKNWVPKRSIAASTSPWQKKMPDRPKPLDEEEFTESFLKGSGPGGQKIVCVRHWGYPIILQNRCEEGANFTLRTKHPLQFN
jgi:hypothetical protein